ncbi:hypothetical protein L218DRAFT_868691 [Marasmius fiardii PR-910]|nr:hypothetical protein L218DRAFT_868691 [Marasmius fiardii PR-910]
MADRHSLTIWTYHNSFPDGSGELDDEGYYTFKAAQVFALSPVGGGRFDDFWDVNHDISFEAGDGTFWHPAQMNGKLESYFYPEDHSDALAVALGQTEFDEDPSMIYMVIKKHGEGKFHRVTHIITPWWDDGLYSLTGLKLSIGPIPQTVSHRVSCSSKIAA